MSKAKILLDNCMWGGTKSFLTDAGYDVVWVGDFVKDPGDTVIVRLAHQENRILITLDKDFGELAIFRGEPHKGIIRIVGHSVTKHGEICNHILNKYQLELSQSAIITVDKTRTRIRL